MHTALISRVRLSAALAIGAALALVGYAWATSVANETAFTPITVAGAAGGSDYYLKLDGIDGESIDKGHKNEIDIMSWSWGMSNSGSMSAGSGGGAGKASFQDMSFMKTYDKASPKLAEACATGQHIKNAKLFVTSTDRPNYLVYTLHDVTCTSVAVTGASNAEMPMESVSFSYGKIEMEYKPASARGTDPLIRFGWDLGTNKKI